MRRLIPWLPAVSWMAAILVFSTSAFSGEHTGGILEPLLRWLVPSLTASQLALVHGLVRKTAHVVEYGILAGLWLRAMVRQRALPLPAAAWTAFAISVAWACVDEALQGTVPSRTGSPTDVALDAAGAGAVLLLATLSAWGRGYLAGRRRTG